VTGQRMAGAPASPPDAIIVHPLAGRALQGCVRVPGDKSISHRAFLLGGLADGSVDVTGAAASGDVLATVEALRRMGARIDANRRRASVDATVAGPLREPGDVLDCGNSGTAMRLLAGVCAGIPGVSVLTGDATLRRRPMDRVLVPLRAMGASVDGRAGGRLAPLVIRGGRLRGIDYRSPVASAQVKSCVLLAGLAAEGRTRVEEPGPSRDHTERMLRYLGADAGVDGDGAWVRGGRLAARPLHVPADPSSAAFWLVAAALVPGSAVRLPEVCLNPRRLGVLDVLRAMGARVAAEADREWCGEPVGDLEVSGGRLGAGQVSGDLVVRAIDELPVLAVAGAVGGGLVVRDAAELRVKESDRIAGVVRMLRAVGVAAEEAPDGFRVAGGGLPGDGRVDSDGDHRIAMAAAVAALVGRAPVTITGVEAVATSYPTFLDDLEALGGHWEPAPRLDAGDDAGGGA
jgi:3-phosphoshikimate 1-carboxyvinyltransferase